MRLVLAVAQIGLAVLLAGHALFGYRMARALPARGGADGETGRLHAGLAAARWPPGVRGAVSLAVLGWVFALAFLGIAGARVAAGALPGGRGIWIAGLLVGARAVAVRGGVPAAAASGAAVLAAVLAALLPSGVPVGYGTAIALHVLAAVVWLGHMFFWSLIAGPALKRLPDGDLGRRLRASSLEGGGLGWPALAVLAGTGAYLLGARGVAAGDLFSPAFLATRFGWALDAKLVLVALMVGYQAVFGHHDAPRAVWWNMGVAGAVLALAAVLAGG